MFAFPPAPSLPGQCSAPHRAQQCSTASHGCTLAPHNPHQGPRSPIWMRFGTQESISEHQVSPADRQPFQGGLHCVFPQTWTAHGFFAVKSPNSLGSYCQKESRNKTTSLPALLPKAPSMDFKQKAKML